MNNRNTKAEGVVTAVVVLIVMVMAVGVSYDVGSGSTKTVTKTSSMTTSETTTYMQTTTVFYSPNAAKTNFTAVFILYGAEPSIQYQFYGQNSTLLGSGALASNSTVLISYSGAGQVILSTHMPQCACSAKISLSANGSLVAVGYNTADSQNNLISPA